jgi:hypothetical protein
VGTGGYGRYREDRVGDAETNHVGQLSPTLPEVNRMVSGVSVKYKGRLHQGRRLSCYATAVESCSVRS